MHMRACSCTYLHVRQCVAKIADSRRASPFGFCWMRRRKLPSIERRLSPKPQQAPWLDNIEQGRTPAFTAPGHTGPHSPMAAAARICRFGWERPAGPDACLPAAVLGACPTAAGRNACSLGPVGTLPNRNEVELFDSDTRHGGCASPKPRGMHINTTKRHHARRSAGRTRAPRRLGRRTHGRPLAGAHAWRPVTGPAPGLSF